MKLAEILKKRGITQIELAKRMGVTRQNVSRWCLNDEGLNIATIRKIAKALHLPITAFVTEDEMFVDLYGRVNTLNREGALKVMDYIDSLNDKYFI